MILALTTPLKVDNIFQMASYIWLKVGLVGRVGWEGE